jgi:hypothetical protein
LVFLLLVREVEAGVRVGFFIFVGEWREVFGGALVFLSPDAIVSKASCTSLEGSFVDSSGVDSGVDSGVGSPDDWFVGRSGIWGY